jgi:tetratricopeptide (TPR) repeat protein
MASTPAAVSSEVESAEASIAQSDWKSAESRLDTWLAAHPTDARALFDAGYVADTQNRLDAAVALYRRAVQANPQSFESHLSLGLLLARQSAFADAHSELKAATKLDGGSNGLALKARAWRALAKLDRDIDPEAASEDLIEALKLTPETDADTLLAAELAEAANEPSAAEAAYRRLLAVDPNSAPASAGLTHILIVRKQYPEAETLLRAALAHTPDDLALSAQLAAVLAAEDKAEALPLLQKLHTAHPTDADLTRMLAQVYHQAGDPAASDLLYQALLKVTPNDAALVVAHGDNLVRQLKFAEALAAFDKATRLDPGNADAWSGLAFAASRLNQPNTTLHALTERSKFLPESPSTYFLWATAYDSLHQKPAAIAYYHHFLDAAAGKFPNQEWQARQRLQLLGK